MSTRYVLVSESGRRWVMSDTNSAGRPTGREDAERIAAELGFALLDTDDDTPEDRTTRT